MASEKGVELSSIQGSGPNGRIIKRDVEGAAAGAPSSAASQQPSGPSSAASAQRAASGPLADFNDVPLTQIRKIIAKRLGESIGPIPTFYLTAELDLTRVMEMRGATMIDHNFTPGFRLRLHHKDLGIALETAKAYGVPLPATALVDQIVGSLRAGGREDLDHSAILTYVEDLAHWKIGDPVQS
jgi:pyruvate/2-oxoglutarate dehydrogenase complex dihydrolipoamide acyltransferase (E2) component